MSTTADPVIMAASATADIFQSVTEACSDWQREIARFVDLRLTADRRSLEALIAARDLADVVKVQQQWATQLATDCTQEAGRVMRLFTTISLTGTTPDVQESAKMVG